MATRTFKIISVAPHLTEGAGIRRGEAKVLSSMSQLVPPTESDPFVHQLQQFDEHLQASGWRDSAAMLVFPSHQVSIRKLEFPFREQKKIDQALEFELGNELLEDVSAFTRSYTIVPNDDGSALVLVYLVPNDYLQAYLALLQNHRLTPVKATFSAQALHEAHPAENARHYQVYLGYDEAFVSCILDQSLHAVKSFPFALPGLYGGEAPKSAVEVLGLLGSSNGAGGGGARRKKDGAGPPWLPELKSLTGEMMRFIKSHSMGQNYSVSIHGLFSRYLAWNADARDLAVQPPADPRAAFQDAAFLGILHEVAADSAAVTAVKGINFSSSRTGLLAHAKEYRRPLAATAALLAVLLMMGGINFGLEILRQQAELARIDIEIKSLLKGVVPANTPPAAAVRMLEARLDKKKKESAAIVRFGDYHYDSMGFLQDLSALLKKYPQLTLRSVSMNAERYTISGTTSSYNASEKFKTQLARIERFKGNEPVITHQRTSENITYRIVINR